MGTPNRLAPPFGLRSLSARGLLIQIRRCEDQLASDPLRAHSSGIQAWSRRPWTRPTGGSLFVRSIGLYIGVASLFGLLLSDVVVIGFSCSALASCPPSIAGLCSALVNLAIRMCLQPSTGRNYGSRCYRAFWTVAVTQGPVRYNDSLPGVQAGLAALYFGSSVSQQRRSVKGGRRCTLASYLCQDISAAYTAHAYVQQTWGSPVWSILEGHHAMGRGGHRGRRPHKSPICGNVGCACCAVLLLRGVSAGSSVPITGEPASLSAHGPFLRPKAAFNSSSGRAWAPSMPEQATLSTWPFLWNLFLLLRRSLHRPLTRRLRVRFSCRWKLSMTFGESGPTRLPLLLTSLCKSWQQRRKWSRPLCLHLMLQLLAWRC